MDATLARRSGTLLNLDKGLLWSEPIARGWNVFMRDVRFALPTSRKLREFGICTVALLTGAHYAFHHHAPEPDPPPRGEMKGDRQPEGRDEEEQRPVESDRTPHEDADDRADQRREPPEPGRGGDVGVGLLVVCRLVRLGDGRDQPRHEDAEHPTQDRRDEEEGEVNSHGAEGLAGCRPV